MQIGFKDRPIIQAPLSQLEHLCMTEPANTVCLLSRGLPDKARKYWARLPRRLRKAQDDHEQLNSVIAELEELAAGSKNVYKSEEHRKMGDGQKRKSF